MIPPQETWNLNTHHLGKQVFVYDRLDSTNTLALSLAEDSSKHGVAILAREQTAGRGQYGRSWQAPPGSSVLLTVLVFPPPSLCRPALLTAWAAVSVCEVVRGITGQAPRIKWPNDVLIDGRARLLPSREAGEISRLGRSLALPISRKICGILIEQRATSSGKVAAAVGIGLNVRQPSEWFENAGLREATSLACLGVTPEFEQVARRLIECLDVEYGRLQDGEREELEGRWVDYLALGEQEVSAEFHDGSVLKGQLLDVSFEGVVMRVDGEERVFTPEMIRHLSESPPLPLGES